MAAKGYVRVRVIIFSLILIILSVIITIPVLPLSDDVKKSLGYPEESLMNFTELTSHYGYSSEEHKVITEDGYILTMFRIPKGKHCNGRKKKPPVLLMHGLLLSSDCWIASGPGAGLAYLLADACYDLWVGNNRGNYYSRSHISLNPDKDFKFWEFYIDEIGYYDIPAMMDYVLNYTGVKKLNYIGYSQGASVYFVMCSERPEYCNKAQVSIALAPASRQRHTKSFIYRTLMESIKVLQPFFSASGINEMLSKGAFGQEFLAFFCQLTLTVDLCNSVEAMFDSYHPGSITNQTLKVLFGHFPAGTSVKNLVRYGQSMRSYKFEKFDYGKQENLKVYGSEHPPLYNLSAVTVPTVVIYGRNDRLVDVKDVMWLVKWLPNVIHEDVSNPLWSHFDVAYSQYTNNSIFPKINEYLSKYSYS